MELLEGKTLREELRSHKRLSPLQTLDIMRGVCRAVEAAHKRDVIHRDLKPENIFITGDAASSQRLVKVLDFGIAKFLPSRDSETTTQMTAATETGVLIGTPEYMSPEQLMGQDLGVHWDLWALTAVVYETLTGALPFAAGREKDWPRSVLHGTFAPVSDYLEKSEQDWQAFFDRNFSSDRPQRSRSAAEFLTQLEEAFDPAGKPSGGAAADA